MHRLGGHVLGFSDSKMTRAGDFYQESIKDTFHMLEYYGDVIAIRHFQQGAPHEAAKWASVPVINCGDGWGEHPTQVLTDLYTILQREGHARRADLPARRRHADADDALDPVRPVAVRRRGDRRRPARHVAPAGVQGRARRAQRGLPRGRRRPRRHRRGRRHLHGAGRPGRLHRVARGARRRDGPHAAGVRRHPPAPAREGQAHARSSSTRCPRMDELPDGRRRHPPPALLGRGVQRRRASGWRSSRSSSARRSRGRADADRPARPRPHQPPGVDEGGDRHRPRRRRSS